MNYEEYITLFHKAQVNLVAFRPVFHCDVELRRMVNMAVAEEREACAKACEEEIKRVKPIYSVTAENALKAIRARSNT